ncbi:MAG: Flp pilus assembly protein CpaB [Candidatus Melainabacteria bacterium]|nr:Flp pilus assembly protein CpaB [Candidatus Melainabacteria bacterium]
MPTVVTSEVSSIFRERSNANLGQPKRKTNPGSIVIVVAVILLVVIGAVRMFTTKPDVKTTATVVGAGTDLAPGSRIHYSSLHYVEVPQKYLTSKMIVSNEQIVGSVLKHFVPQGEPITADDIFPGKNALSNNIETHERAITLRLEPEALVDNLLAPDDMVDVIATTTKDGKHFSKTICQNARVLLTVPREALESRTLRVADGHRVTVAAGPKEAELISHAAETGKIRLVLRSRLSRKVASLTGVGDDDLLPAKALLPVPTAPMQIIAAPPAPLTVPNIDLPPDPQSVSEQRTGLPSIMPEPVKWVVEMFSGSRKELYALPIQN